MSGSARDILLALLISTYPDRNSVLGGNMNNDLTQAVVQGLDAKLTEISFNREVLAAR